MLINGRGRDPASPWLARHDPKRRMAAAPRLQVQMEMTPQLLQLNCSHGHPADSVTDFMGFFFSFAWWGVQHFDGRTRKAWQFQLHGFSLWQPDGEGGGMAEVASPHRSTFYWSYRSFRNDNKFWFVRQGSRNGLWLTGCRTGDIGRRISRNPHLEMGIFPSVPRLPRQANIVCYKINDPHFVFKCYRNDCQCT